MNSKLKKYNINQCALYKCKSLNRLKNILLLNSEQLEGIEADISYKQFHIAKKDSGEKRQITAPNPRIKKIQSRILYLLQKVERPFWLISGEKGKCYIDNGKVHLSSNYFLTIDIKKFYDNCKREYVYSFFKNHLLMAGDIAKICTDIVTYNKGIPTGCPTSQIIAYYAYQDMFNEINDSAIKRGCIFTLYVDDMTFSSETSFEVNKLKMEVDVILRKYGHKPKYSKMKYYTKGKSTLITGTIVTGKHELRVPNTLQKKVYNNFQDIKFYANKSIKDVTLIKKIHTLNGQIQAARNIEEVKFPEIKRITNTVKIKPLTN